jgi:membrane protein DedA with SNARE-associated domain
MPDITIALVCVAGVCGPLLLGAAGIVLMAESALLVGLLLPGSSTVLVVGSVIGFGGVDPVLAAVVMVAASSGGAQTAFLLHRRRGNAAQTAPTPKGRAPSAIAVLIQRIFDRHATAASVASHLVGGTRTFGPRLAADSPMSYRAFAICNIVAAAVWVSVLLLIGNIVGANPQVAPFFVALGICLLAVTYVLGIVRRRVAVP